MSADRRAPNRIALASPWDYECPHCGGFNWCPDEGKFLCRSCGDHFTHLRDSVTGELAGGSR